MKIPDSQPVPATAGNDPQRFNLALQIEEARQNLLQTWLTCPSPRQRLFHTADFLSKILDPADPVLEQAFLPEFLPYLLDDLEHYNGFGFPPEISGQIPNILQRLAQADLPEELQIKISRRRDRLTTRQQILEMSLKGENSADSAARHLYFPVIGQESGEDRGHLEKLVIRILKTRRENRFLIIPANEQTDNILQQQLRDSWQAALAYLNRQHIRHHYEVIVEFEQSGAFYQGNSLGTALTLGFIETLMTENNMPIVLRINPGLVSTGGMNSSGDILPVSDEIIITKLRTVFFSDRTMFIVPEANLGAAQQELNRLLADYPARNLKLAGLHSLDDLLDRRSLVHIHRQSPPRRVLKSMQLHPAAFSLLLLVMLLSVLSGLLLIKEMDGNPAILENKGDLLTIKNKAGKVLWTKPYHPLPTDEPVRKEIIRLIDVDSDGSNEVLVCDEPSGSLAKACDTGRLACFDARGRLIWQYVFRDSIRTVSENFENIFRIKMIDTVTVDQQRQLIAFANHVRWYPSAVFRLDLRSGRRLPGTLWNSGQFQTGLIKNIPDSTGKELIITGFNNSWDQLILLSVSLNNLDGAAPATEPYCFIGKNPARLRNYILLPVSDLTTFYNFEANEFCLGGLRHEKNENQISAITREARFEDATLIGYSFDYNLNPTRLVIGDPFIFRRDKLVREGKLSPPLTETPEYHKLLLDQILFWDGDKLVNRHGRIF